MAQDSATNTEMTLALSLTLEIMIRPYLNVAGTWLGVDCLRTGSKIDSVPDYILQ